LIFIQINKYKEPVFEVITKLDHQKWVHQVIGSIFAGYLCGHQRDRKTKVCVLSFIFLICNKIDFHIYDINQISLAIESYVVWAINNLNDAN